MTLSHLELKALQQIKAAKMPEPVMEYKFNKTRKWRADFAWFEHKVILEVEGGIYSQGRHTRPQGFINDCEKYNEAALQDWIVLRVTSEHIESGYMLSCLERAFRKSIREKTLDECD